MGGLVELYPNDFVSNDKPYQALRRSGVFVKPGQATW